MDALEAENARLRSELQALQLKYAQLDALKTERIQKLTDENEILAEANSVLMENSAKFQRFQSVVSASGGAAAGGSASSVLHIPDELLLPGAGLTTQEIQVVEETHSFGNLLSVATHALRRGFVVTGGADKYICVHDWQSKQKLCEFAASAPVLDLAFNPNPRFADYFVATFMDGKHGVYRLVNNSRGTDGEEPLRGWEVDEIQRFHEHTRPGAMKVAWNSNGNLFATGASDKSLHIYRCTGLKESGGTGDEEKDASTCEKTKSFYFNGTVEAITFIPATPQQQQKEGEELVDGSAMEICNELLAIAVRDDCYVHYVDCVTFEKERINMNQDGIEHVSYTIMDLRISPSGKYLLAATDTSRHLIFGTKSNVVLRNLYGHNAGPYSQPRAVWHPSEKYVISNTEDSGSLFVWCIASERVLDTIAAHEALVRDLACSHIEENQVTLITVSYDKRLKVWTSMLNDNSPTNPVVRA